MARGYRISDEARSDLDDTWLYIGRRNSTAADAVIDACFEKGLSSQPGLGHQRPATPGGCRSWVVPRFQNYVIVLPGR